MTVQTLFVVLRDKLRQAQHQTGLDIDAAAEAEEILRVCCGLSRQTRLLEPKRCVSSQQAAQALRAAELRERGEPLGYVLGISPFFGEDFLVRVDKDRTLIPRSDTEILVQALIDRLHPGDHFLDLCCGSGCVALSALKNSPGTVAFGVDIDAGACRIAQKNAARMGLDARFSVLQGDILQDIAAPGIHVTSDSLDKEQEMQTDAQYHYIVSNPPYIPTSDLAALDIQVQKEPRAALDGGEDGLLFYRTILRRYRGALRAGGAFLFEIGFDQRDALFSLAALEGMHGMCLKDFAGHDRVVVLHPS